MVNYIFSEIIGQMIIGQESGHRGNSTGAFLNYVKGLLTALTLNLDTKAQKYQNPSQRSLFLMTRMLHL